MRSVSHATPRFTKDLDLWVNPTLENLSRVRAALVSFGAPAAIIDPLERASLDDVLWMGVPPVRIDILKGVPGGEFQGCYSRRIQAIWDGARVDVIARPDLIAIKRASGRPRDLLDIEELLR